MIKNKTIRFVHKYISFFISLQLLLWTVSGIYFSFNKIENVRGEQYVLPIQAKEFNINPPDLKQASEAVNYFYRLDQIIYSIKNSNGIRYYDQDHRPVKKISFDQAKQIVNLRTTLKALSVSLVNSSSSGSEYRGRQLPLYKVSAKSESDSIINVYVDPYSGNISLIRSNQWRLWDFLWGLHIMDWIERDNIDNYFLKFFSILALISSISGIILFFKVKKKSF
jgi:uncharacterized iron-regulated membrane protein